MVEASAPQDLLCVGAHDTSCTLAEAQTPSAQVPDKAASAQESVSGTPLASEEQPYCRECGASETRCWRTGPAGQLTLLTPFFQSNGPLHAAGKCYLTLHRVQTILIAGSG